MADQIGNAGGRRQVLDLCIRAVRLDASRTNHLGPWGYAGQHAEQDITCHQLLGGGVVYRQKLGGFAGPGIAVRDSLAAVINQGRLPGC